MTRQIYIILILAQTLYMAGCTSNIPNPNNAPTTTLVMTASSAGVGENTDISLINCEKSLSPLGIKALLSKFYFGKHGPYEAKLPVGEATRIEASFINTVFGTTTSGQLGGFNKTCLKFFEIIPVANQKYILHGDKCNFTLKELDPNLPPSIIRSSSQEDICPIGSAYAKSVSE